MLWMLGPAYDADLLLPVLFAMTKKATWKFELVCKHLERLKLYIP